MKAAQVFQTAGFGIAMAKLAPRCRRPRMLTDSCDDEGFVLDL
jgi:hypothetical protein